MGRLGAAAAAAARAVRARVASVLRYSDRPSTARTRHPHRMPHRDHRAAIIIPTRLSPHRRTQLATWKCLGDWNCAFFKRLFQLPVTAPATGICMSPSTSEEWNVLVMVDLWDVGSLECAHSQRSVLIHSGPGFPARFQKVFKRTGAGCALCK